MTTASVSSKTQSCCKSWSIAVAGGTGTVGRLTVDSVRAAGHEAVVLTRSNGVDRVPHGYYAGKVAQEKVVELSSVPWTIVRATQFHEFAGQMFGQAKFGPLHIAPRARIQPIAAREVGDRLTRIASEGALGRANDLAGPREEKLSDMVKDYARSTGYRGWIPEVTVPGAQMKGMRAGLVLPGPDATLGTETFEQWLAVRS